MKKQKKCLIYNLEETLNTEQKLMLKIKDKQKMILSK